MSKRTIGRVLFAVSSAMVSLSITSAASAQSPNAPVGEFLGLFVEATVGQYQMLCGARQPESAVQWKTDVTRFRQTNAAALTELRAIATGIESFARNRAFNPASKESAKDREGQLGLIAQFGLLAATQPAIELARSNDAQALEVCKAWQESVQPGGPLEAGLPQAVAGGRRLLQAASERR